MEIILIEWFEESLLFSFYEHEIFNFVFCIMNFRLMIEITYFEKCNKCSNYHYFYHKVVSENVKIYTIL